MIYLINGHANPMPVSRAQTMPMQDSLYLHSAEHHAVQKSGLTYLAVKMLAWLALVSVFAAIGLYLYFSNLHTARFSSSQKPVEVVIANTVLLVPENMIRFEKQRVSQATDKLDLFVSWPDMNGYRETTKALFESSSDASNLVFVTIEPRAMMHDMSGRLRPIYARFFEGVGILGPSGLVQQPLNSAAGFIDEDLFFDPSSPYPFVARCTRAGQHTIRATCLRDIHLGKDLMMTYRFDKKLLPHWTDLDDKVRALGYQFRHR